MFIKRILITVLLTVVGAVLTPMTIALTADSVGRSRPQRELPEEFGSADLMTSEREAIARYQRNAELAAFISVMGGVGGAVLGVVVTRQRSKVSKSVN